MKTTTKTMKSTKAMRSITVRRTGDIRLTAAACACPYHVAN